MNDSFLRLVFFIFVIPSAIIHEYMHGFVADKLGDPTARYAGRLTLNPVAHIDLWGTILLPFFLYITTGFTFAYAKPVPYNPYNLRNQRWGPVAVAVAGPLSNILLAIIFGVLVQFFPPGMLSLYLSVIVYVNVLLAVFNLLPIPPLDGSKFLYALMPASSYNLQVTLERYGFVFLIIFVIFFSRIIHPVVDFFYNLFTAGQGLL